jgi:hypothetical protein
MHDPVSPKRATALLTATCVALYIATISVSCLLDQCVAARPVRTGRAASIQRAVLEEQLLQI